MEPKATEEIASAFQQARPLGFPIAAGLSHDRRYPQQRRENAREHLLPKKRMRENASLSGLWKWGNSTRELPAKLYET